MAMRVSGIFNRWGGDGPPPSDAECAQMAVGANAKYVCRWFQNPDNWYGDKDISDQEIHSITGE